MRDHENDASTPHRSKPHNRFDFLVVGAGIGGLSIGILLAQAGHRVRIIERRSSYDDLSGGGGISLMANAVSSLELMGIGKNLLKIADIAPHTVIMRYATREIIGTRQSIQPHLMVHRHDLVLVLYERALELGIDIRFGKRLAAVDFSQTSSVVFFQDQTSMSAEIIIGADGVNSTLRKWLHPELRAEAITTSDCVFLLDVPGHVMRSFDSTRALCDLPPYQLWLGPGRGIVAWYMETRDVYHLQMCELEFGNGEAYGGDQKVDGYVSKYEDMERLRRRWSDFNDSVRQITSSTESCTKWRIASAPSLPSWIGHSGRLILLGDAAHAFPPFAGQGAGMAIEDAACLATLIEYAQCINDMEAVGQVYERVRRPRIDKIRRVVVTNGTIFSLYDGEQQQARDEGIRAASDGSSTREIPQDGRQWSRQVGERKQAIEDYDAVEEARRGWQNHLTKL